jgi:hypothetical protein
VRGDLAHTLDRAATCGVEGADQAEKLQFEIAVKTMLNIQTRMCSTN